MGIAWAGGIYLPSKYKNHAQWVDGVYWHSKGELKYWGDLKWREHAGEIQHLERQKKFDLIINGVKIESYTADFIFFENGRRRVLDFKGHITRDFRRKQKWMKAFYQIDVEVVR